MLLEITMPEVMDPLLEALPLVDGKPLLGNILIESRVGRGATSHVFFGRHQAFNYPVVVKMMRKGELADPLAWERFLREGSIALQIRHPNVIRVHEYNHHNGVGYLVMEFVQGVTLGHCIFHTPLREKRALEIMLPIAEGLSAIWEAGFLHADVKPDNILVPVEDTAPRLLDLGFARPLHQHDPLLQSNTTAGTPYYMSPELARGVECICLQSDMFSFGATMYHALTGEVPFEGATEADVMRELQMRDPVTPMALNHDVTEKTSDFVLRCMHKDPMDRFDSAEQFIGALKKLAE
jgi:eukaryotic-like serine/threonine-protein kinase